jgi:hypothetical protein
MEPQTMAIMITVWFFHWFTAVVVEEGEGEGEGVDAA